MRDLQRQIEQQVSVNSHHGINTFISNNRSSDNHQEGVFHQYIQYQDDR